ncbi:unnamed protein product [Protopolystoma xenopodis]|uniref:Uncharacterized protein n=1 Tax=Protopolystoma xenopodis TaxID=117903 RepID=A0A3S5FGW4_9PLAT|nr:unnamed protein product [Protopolystoma xenopodis]
MSLISSRVVPSDRLISRLQATNRSPHSLRHPLSNHYSKLPHNRPLHHLSQLDQCNHHPSCSLKSLRHNSVPTATTSAFKPILSSFNSATLTFESLSSTSSLQTPYRRVHATRKAWPKETLGNLALLSDKPKQSEEHQNCLDLR